jgi:hypothetical protein
MAAAIAGLAIAQFGQSTYRRVFGESNGFRKILRMASEVADARLSHNEKRSASGVPPRSQKKLQAFAEVLAVATRQVGMGGRF